MFDQARFLDILRNFVVFKRVVPSEMTVRALAVKSDGEVFGENDSEVADLAEQTAGGVLRAFTFRRAGQQRGGRDDTTVRREADQTRGRARAQVS